MVNNKTMRELGEEYEAAASRVKERIAKKRGELRALNNSICSNEAYELKSELSVLYREYRDAREIAEYLKSYYEPHTGRRELFEN
ncbi:MAG: hypothetical protein ACI4JG_08605 [Acutalibacteraceae bacterium]